MPEIKNTFLKGKMNKSLDDRLLPEGEYRNALNVQVSETEDTDVGALQNIKGNSLVYNSGFSSNAVVIGSFFDDKNNRVFYFVKDGSNNHIYSYTKGEITEAVNSLISSYIIDFGYDVGGSEILVYNGGVLLQNTVDYTFSKTEQRINFTLPVQVSEIKIETIPVAIVSGNFLNFSEDHLITGINVVEDLLFWTDNLNEPRRINIQTALEDTSYYDSNDKINVAKYSPFEAPEITSMSNEGSIKSKYIEDKFIRFSYRFKFKENEYSQIAPFSPIAFIPKTLQLTSDQVTKAYEQAYLQDFVNNINQVDLSIPLPTDAYDNHEIRSVEILVKESNSNAVRVIYKQNVSPSSTSINYSYKSELPSTTIPEEQIIRVTDNIPTKALAQEVSGNRIIYGNFEQNYDLPSIDYTLEVNDKINSTLTSHSIKQRRNYEVGIVLADKYGRKSPVILGSNPTITVPAKTADAASWPGDSIKLTFTDLPSGEWHSYRVVIKQKEQEYYNVYIPGLSVFNDISYFTVFGDNVNKIPRNSEAITFESEISSSNTYVYPKLINQSFYSAHVENTESVNINRVNYTVTIGGSSPVNWAYWEAADGQYVDEEISSSQTINVPAGNSIGGLAPTVEAVKVYVDGMLASINQHYTTTGGSNITSITFTSSYEQPVGRKITIFKKLRFSADAGVQGTGGHAIKALTYPEYSSLGGGSITIGTTEEFNIYTYEGDGTTATYPLLAYTTVNQINSDDDISKIQGIGLLSSFSDITDTFIASSGYDDNRGFYKASNNYLLASFASDAGLGLSGDNLIITGKLHDLAVLETKPFESTIDIYYETPTGGLVSSLSNGTTIEIDYYNTFIVKGPTSGSDPIWHIEESRIRGDFNADSVDYGVQAHIVDNEYAKGRRENTLIYSGIYNPNTGINNTNQFASGKNITKSLDIQNGSIQKLFAEDTNLNVFQEEKVSWVAIDKDVLYTAEGSPQVTTSDVVFGQVVPYSSNYGIGTNPESFAYYAGRKYFVDKPKGAVLRLSRDGITEISNYGMRSYFRDNLKNYSKIIGAWDIHNSQYVVSMQLGNQYQTLGFKEGVNGWVSFYSYNPESAGYLDAIFYTFKDGNIWSHYSNNSYNNFYGQGYNSSVDLIFNQNPSASKNFLTINYEGTNSWNISSIETDTDRGLPVNKYDSSLIDTDNYFHVSRFDKVHGKYVSNIMNDTLPKENEVNFGNAISGIKGFYMQVNAFIDSSDYQELFSISTNYNINSY